MSGFRLFFVSLLLVWFIAMPHKSACAHEKSVPQVSSQVVSIEAGQHLEQGFAHKPVLAKSIKINVPRTGAKSGIPPEQDNIDESLAPGFNASRSALFLHLLQTHPEFGLIWEFEFTQPLKQLLAPPEFILALPWYLRLESYASSRLSGWKDANLLYLWLIP